MRTGQRVTVTPSTPFLSHPRPPYKGRVVAYVLAVGVGDGCVEERARIVVQSDQGRIYFAEPSSVRVELQDEGEVDDWTASLDEIGRYKQDAITVDGAREAATA